MGIQVRQLEYSDGGTGFEGHVAWDDSASEARPGVLVAHTWRGRTEFEDRKAERLAELGYVGLALDLYGKGIQGDTPERCAGLMQPLLDDRALLQRRLGLAHDQLRGLGPVDAERTAAIGFCFGGLCVLDMARSGAGLRGVVSFHGLLQAPDNLDAEPMAAKVLVLHGWRDPMATPEQVMAFADEMQERSADWQVHAYGTCMHAFTNPAAADEAGGLLYDPVAEHRSWDSMQLFLNEVLA